MRVCIVSHDAGGAENLARYVVAQNDINPLFVLAGPAIKVFAQQIDNIKIANLGDALAACDWCLCGTGWQSDLEWMAIALARKAGKRTTAFLDHWVNYRERFIRNGQEALPDEIWVADEYAKKLAEKTFPGLMIKQQPNRYLEALVAEIRCLEIKKSKRTGKNILYVLEPIRQPWGSKEKPGEFQALDYFIKQMGRLNLGDPLSIFICLRPHPSDPMGKYDAWVDAQIQMNNKIRVDTSSSLAEMIAEADLVVGCHTFAMVVALSAGKMVVSSIPPWAPQCLLPQPEIIRLADLA